MISGETIDEFESNFHQAVDSYLHEKDKKKARRRRRAIVRIVVLATLLVALASTVPEQDKHVKTLADTISGINDVAELDESEALVGVLSSFGGNLMNHVLKRNLVVDKYVFFNVGKIHYQGEFIPVSVGVFNHVFTLRKEEIVNRVDKDREMRDALDAFGESLKSGNY